MTAKPPTPKEQVQFLHDIQRLLAEGQFTASYKLALLHAIADLCVIQGDDSGGELVLNVKDISEKFIELYWQQCRPFQLGGKQSGLVLLQNKGKQAAVVRKIITAQEDFGGSLARLKNQDPSLWNSLKGDVKRTVNEMPLWKLQRVGSERLSFLYDNLDATTKTITLKSGVAFCFRAFYGLMRDLIQGAWVRFVQKVNAESLGSVTDLGTFLFDRQRSSLESYRPILSELQERRCFYCSKDLKSNSEVDHFIPWARYPTDLGHNFVLAHKSCNNSKSDFLGAEQHLERWSGRNEEKAEELRQRLEDAGLPNDFVASVSIAAWAYEQVEKSNGQVWLAKKQFESLSREWRLLLAV